MLPRAPLFALLVLHSIAGCDGSSPSASAPADAAPEPAPEAAPDPAVGPDTKADTNSVKGSQPEQSGKDGRTRLSEAKAELASKPDEAKRARERLAVLLNEGRKAVKDKRYDDGIAAYNEALTLDPVHPKLLGELGFAALRKGDLALAESATRRAIEFSKDDSSLGATYYNLGLIEEQRGKPAEARTAYERSLAVRPGNKTVEAKLAALDVSATASGPSSAAGLCASVREEWECVAKGDPNPDAPVCDCAVENEITEGSGDSFITAAALLSLVGDNGYSGMIDNRYLAVKTKGQGWQLVGMVVNGYMPGMMGISNEGKVLEFAFEDVAAAPGEELRLLVENSEVDTDMGVNLIHSWDSQELLICYDSSGAGAGAGAGGGVCGSLPTAVSAVTDALWPDEPVDPESQAEIGERTYAFDFALADGKLALTIKSGESVMTPATRALAGERSVEASLALIAGATTLH